MSSDDPSGSGRNDEDESPPQQGRWLGAVRSWIGGAEDGDGAEPQGTVSTPAVASSPALSADEIRRRRLEKMEGSRSQQVYVQQQYDIRTAVGRLHRRKTGKKKRMAI